jgi:hypothetical protein
MGLTWSQLLGEAGKPGQSKLSNTELEALVHQYRKSYSPLKNNRKSRHLLKYKRKSSPKQQEVLTSSNLNNRELWYPLKNNRKPWNLLKNS